MGYTDVAAVADASADELSTVHTINPQTARYIRQAVKELRGDDDTIQTDIAAT